jgi:hypothetical protein
LPVFFGNTIQGGTMVNTATSKMSLCKKKKFCPCDAKDPGKISPWKIKYNEVSFNKIKTRLVIHKKAQWQLGRKTYASSG